MSKTDKDNGPQWVVEVTLHHDTKTYEIRSVFSSDAWLASGSYLLIDAVDEIAAYNKAGHTLRLLDLTVHNEGEAK